MSSESPGQLTEVELQILHILWELGPSPVRDIHPCLNAKKGTNYSTTVKMLSVMLQKKLVSRTEETRPHVYRAGLSRKVAGKRMVKDLVARIYEGSAMSLVLQALATEQPTPEEIHELRRLLDEKEGQK